MCNQFNKMYWAVSDLLKITHYNTLTDRKSNTLLVFIDECQKKKTVSRSIQFSMTVKIIMTSYRNENNKLKAKWNENVEPMYNRDE